MKWATIICFAPAVAWTAVSFLGYRDLSFAFQNSLISWVACGLLWGVLWIAMAGLGKSRRSGKAKPFKGGRVAVVAGVAGAGSVAIFILSVATAQWMEKRKTFGREALSIAVRPGAAPNPIEPEPPAREGSIAVSLQNGEALWSVQVSAFKTEQNAVDLAAALKKRGWEVYVIRAKVEASDLYRIHVGRFRTREAAERLLEKLKDKEDLKSAFVSKM